MGGAAAIFRSGPLSRGGGRGSLRVMSERLAGVLLPAFSTRRAGDLGIGDTRGMIGWIDRAAETGIGFLQLLPINETGGDDSPYNAISSVALEPLYLAMEDVPGVEPADLQAARAELGPALDSPRVLYSSVRRAKRALLEKAWRRFGVSVGFDRFRHAEKDWLEPYSLFRWLMERYGSEDWESWPCPDVAGARAELASARESDPAEVEDRMGFHAWVQWLAFGQWAAVRRHADEAGVKLMGDVPIGVSRRSADVFSERGEFDLEWCGGAPPETVFKHDLFIQRWGQNWGIPLYRWDRMEAANFPWWRRRIGKLTEVFHIFRIDHVLGFYRIYAFPWQPGENGVFLELSDEEAAVETGGSLPCWWPRADDTAPNRAANRAEGETRLRMVIEAAGNAEVVGEDLGCVPDYVRPHLASLGIAGFRIPQWDHDDDGKVIPRDEIPPLSFATYATHDHEPLPALWERLRREAASGELDKEEVEAAAGELKRMADFAGLEEIRPYGPETRMKLLTALFGSRARYAAIMATELFDLPDRINAPGTVGPHNWSWRLPWTLEDSPGKAFEELEEALGDRGVRRKRP